MFQASGSGGDNDYVVNGGGCGDWTVAIVTMG
jgi:hypothetical protein